MEPRLKLEPFFIYSYTKKNYTPRPILVQGAYADVSKAVTIKNSLPKIFALEPVPRQILQRQDELQLDIILSDLNTPIDIDEIARGLLSAGERGFKGYPYVAISMREIRKIVDQIIEYQKEYNRYGRSS